MIDQVMNYFRDAFEGRFSKAERKVFVTTKDELNEANGQSNTLLVFTHYVQFTNLENEFQDYTYPQYNIVFTAVVNLNGQMKMYVNTLHKFRAPGTFKPGLLFSDLRTGIRNVTTLFETDGFVDMLDRQPVPFGKETVDLKRFASKALIESVDVDDNMIKVAFKRVVNAKNVKEVSHKVFADIRGLLELKMKTQIKYRIVSLGGNKFGMEFVLILPKDIDSAKFLTIQKMEALKMRFNFDDEDLKKIVQIVNKG